MLIHGVTEDGKGLEVLRAREEGLELGQVRPLEHGKPLQGEIVRLRPRAGAPFVCDVETELSLPQGKAAEPHGLPRSASSPQAAKSQATKPSGARHTEAPRKGPPQVASPAYRQNWDRIWSSQAAKKDERPN